jgi:hypothetical protein
MTWGWRIVAAVAFLAVMFRYSKILHALADNGYQWVIAGLIVATIRDRVFGRLAAG